MSSIRGNNQVIRVLGYFVWVSDDEDRSEANVSAVTSLVAPSISWIAFLAFPTTSASLAAVAIGCCFGIIVSFIGMLHGALFGWGNREKHWKRQWTAGLIGFTVSLSLAVAVLWSTWRLIFF